MIYIAVLTLGFTQMFALLASTQQLYADSYDRAANFPLWFMLTALLAGAGTIVNADLVMRIGMRRLALGQYAAQAAFAVVLVLAFWLNIVPEAIEFCGVLPVDGVGVLHGRADLRQSQRAGAATPGPYRRNGGLG